MLLLFFRLVSFGAALTTTLWGAPLRYLRMTMIFRHYWHSPPSRNKYIAVRVWVLHGEAVARAVSRSWTPTDGLLGLDVPHHYAADTKTNGGGDDLFSYEASSTKVFWAAPSSDWEFTPVVVLSAEGNQVSIIRGEVHCLHLRLVKLQLGVDCSLSIVPDNHNGLGTHTFINYLSDNVFFLFLFIYFFKSVE